MKDDMDLPLGEGRILTLGNQNVRYGDASPVPLGEVRRTPNQPLRAESARGPSAVGSSLKDAHLIGWFT
jgi:hypothetical protein